MTSPLDYVPATVPDDCKFKISPSAFGTFIDQPWNWYRQQIQKLDVFEYNTMSVAGTIIHYCAEQVAKNEKVDEQAIEDYISAKENNEFFNQDEVRNIWYDMAHTLINDYLLSQVQTVLAAEQQICAEIKNKYYVAGTADLLQGTKEDCILTDYKSYSSKIKPKSITGRYKYQLLTYAWALRKNGYNVNRIRLVFVNRFIDGGISEKTGKPLKSYPPEVTVLTETITQEDLDYIESMLELCVDSLEASIKHPELAYLIFHDMRIKNNE